MSWHHEVVWDEPAEPEIVEWRDELEWPEFNPEPVEQDEAAA